MRVTGRRTIAVAALLALLGACGDDGPDPQERERDYVDALAAASDLDPLWADEARTCAAEAVVTAVGLDELEATVGSPDDVRAEGELNGLDELGLELTDAQRDEFYAELSACTDTTEMFVAVLEQAAEAQGAGEAGDATVSCLREAVDDDFLRDWAHALFVLGTTNEDEDFQDRQVDVYAGCIALG